ncbi:MAG: YlmC/YmxH family sporulation protein [Clostridia bacterium]|nr:YlmC/YmxH family sporulation protein [Clostridia bacterium]
MELSFSELRAKEVVNTQDGKKLGKVCDVALCYPENRWLGIVVPNGRGFAFKKNELFIDLKHIVKIGEDVILVNIGLPRKQNACKNERGGAPVPPPNIGGGRNYEEFE